jgi:mRNA interferase RelE/StbE
MAYRIRIESSARKDIRRLDPRVAQQATAAITALSDDPRPPGYIHLTASDDYRITVARDYRVIYSIDDTARTVTILVVGHRSNIYKRYKRR